MSRHAKPKEVKHATLVDAILGLLAMTVVAGMLAATGSVLVLLVLTMIQTGVIPP